MPDILKMFKMIARAFVGKTACERYPDRPAHRYPNTRGHIEIEAGECILCTICDKRCPTHAITVDRSKKTWAIDHYKCIYCNNCVEVCPKKCLHMLQKHGTPTLEKHIHSVNIPLSFKKKSKPQASGSPSDQSMTAHQDKDKIDKKDPQ
jgi:ech hydrogenase subunit F